MPGLTAMLIKRAHGAAGTSGLAMGPNDWPEGCINFAVNLVRPVQEGHRKKALYSVLSQTLVFDTLENASSYRESVTQVMCCACACHASDDSIISRVASHQSAWYAWCLCHPFTLLAGFLLLICIHMQMMAPCTLSHRTIQEAPLKHLFALKLERLGEAACVQTP